MKLCITILFVLIIFLPAQSQINVPLFSEPGSITQRVGNTNFKISYERPKANGRKIFGPSELVPFGIVWRTGASLCTKISFDKAVFIDNKELPKGTYSLFTIPNTDEWTIILNTDTTLYGAYDYEAQKDIVRMQASVEISPIHTETFNINVDIHNDVAMMRLSWLDNVLTVPIETRTYENLLNEAKDILTNNYSLEEGTYTLCAEYILHNMIGFGDNALSIASQLVDKALRVEKENHYNYSYKRKILKLQNKKEEFMKYSELLIQYLESAKPYEGYEESVEDIKLEMTEWEG